ncbi:MAG: AsmA family protein [Oceanicaulis sp.]
MRRLLIILLVLAFAVIGAAFVIPALIPSNALRERVERAAGEALGREVTLSGDIGLRLLPSVQVSAADARIANAEGFSGEPFAEMAQMRFALALAPLLSRRIEVEEFILVEPTIRLETRGGVNNWTLGAPSPEAGVAPASGEGFVRAPGALPFEASFGDVRVIDGLVIYNDGTQTRRIEEFNLDVSLPGVDAPMRLSGGFSADGRPMSFEAGLGSLRAVFEGGETPVDLEVTGALADLAFDGRVLEGETIAFEGDADIRLPLRALARYLGTDLPEGDIFQTFTARTALSGAPGRINLTGAEIGFDDIAASGDLQLAYDRARPMITGALTSPRLDITPYIPAETEAGGPGAGAGGGVGPWSTEPIDLAPLRTVDADVTVRADLFKARDIEAEDVTVRTRLDNGVLTARLSDFQLYGGRGEVLAVVNARAGAPRYRLTADIASLEALPFLSAAAGFDRLAGLGALNLDLTATGDNPAAIMESLSGQGGFDFADGAIVGVNLAQVIRTVQQAVQTGSLPSGFAETQQTDFTALTGTIDIENGVARNLDLTMLSPLLRVAGTGQVDLGAQQIEYRLTPRAVQAITGQGGDLNLQGLEVPIRIRGGFNDVSVGVDFEAVARNLVRARAGDLIGGDVGRALGEGQSIEDAARNAAGDALRRALGGEEPADGEETQPDPGALLRGLLNRNRREPQPAPEGGEGEGEGEGGGGSGEDEPQNR